jgi:hypothetical protein
MNNEIKENKDTLKNTYGGFADYDRGDFIGKVFVISPNEAKILKIQPGEYSSHALADAVRKNGAYLYLGSKVLQKLQNQVDGDDMLEILTGDAKKGEGLGFTRN